MKYRKQDPNGDFTFGQQQQDYFHDTPEAVAQAVATRLRLLRGEWFLDKRVGMPWREEVLGKYTGGLYDNAIRQHILGTQGVTELTAYESLLDTEGRFLAVRATVSTVFGAAVVEAAL